MESLLKQDQINFQVLEDNSNTLQVILLPNQTLYTDILFISYCSSNLSFREVPVSLWKKLTQVQIGLRYRLKNRKGGVEYTGLSKSSGKILAINPFVLEDVLILSKSYILAYSSGVKISQVPDPNFLLKKITWREIKGNGIIFIQGRGSIIEKRLGDGEEICVNKNEIIAHSKTVKVSEANMVRSYKAFLFNDWCLMKLKGPGWVFIDGYGGTKEMDYSMRRRREILNVFLLFVLLTFVITLEILLKI